MADELRRQCSNPGCRRRFSNYNNLVLHESTAHLTSNVLQQLCSVHTGQDSHHYSSAVRVSSDVAPLPSVEEELQSNYCPPGQSTNQETLLFYAAVTLTPNNLDELPGETTDHTLDIERGLQPTSPTTNVASRLSLKRITGNICTQSTGSLEDDSLGPNAEEDPLLSDFVIRDLSTTNDVVDQSLTRDIHAFYNSFHDSSRILFAEVTEPDQKLIVLPQACQEVITYCMRKRMSQDEIVDHYEHISSLERFHIRAPAGDDRGWSSTVTGIFGCSKTFTARVLKERKILVKTQGWRLASIVNSLVVPQGGVFLPLMVVLDRIVRRAGGIDKIQSYSERLNAEGNRLYSSPIDSDIIKAESKLPISEASETYPKLFFSLYCAETLLAKSGSQDAAVVRIRADNVKCLNTEWFDVGIPPKLMVGSGYISDGKKRAAKLDLLHRFLFLILEEISSPSLISTVRKYGYEPCLLDFVVDQPQEREFCCLKRGNSEQDCSVCCFKNAKDRKRKKTARESEISEPDRTSMRQNLSSIQQKYKEDSSVSDDSAYANDIADENEAGIPHPQDIRQFENRDPRRTVLLQLQADVERRRKSKESSFILKGVNAVPVERLAREVSEELFKEGALPFAPVFGCLKGICNELGRLYTLPTIDLLHLGPSKQFCDDTFLVRENPLYGGPLVRSKHIRVLNQRVSDLPGDTEVKGMKPFKKTDSDRQASYSGKQRRLLCPVIWSVLPGLSRVWYSSLSTKREKEGTQKIKG